MKTKLAGRTIIATFALALIASFGVGAIDATPANAACLSATKWSTSGSERKVTVKNSCASSKQFKVDIKLYPDRGPYSVAGKSTKTVTYITTNGPKGRGIYEV